MKRRQFLAAGSAAGAALVAGCGGRVAELEDEEDLKQEVPAPTITEEKLNGWSQVGDGWAQKYYDGRIVDAVGHGVRYEDEAFSARVKDETFGRVDQSLAQFFAARVDFFPEIAHNATVFQDIQEKAESQLADRLRGQDALQNVSKDGEVETVQVATGETVDLVGYSARYPVERIVVEDVQIPGAGTRSFEIPSQTLDVQGVVGQWKHDKSVYIAGGVYPNDDFTASPRTSISGGEEGTGIDIVVDVNIDLDRERRKVRDLIRSVR